MSAIGDRDMPVIDAWPLDGPFSGHWAAAFPEGERTYPSAKATVAAAMRIGSAVHFRPARAAADDMGDPPLSVPPPQREVPEGASPDGRESATGVADSEPVRVSARG